MYYFLISFYIDWPVTIYFILYVFADDFTKQTHGMVLMYTLKNPSYPEHIIETKSGVLCLDNHPEYPNLIAVGFYDGSVGVINVKDSENAMKYLSTAKTGKHTDPVWQVGKLVD